ncbi:STAS domain-containing protein [Cerasicoccus fimbriatus]|uniref:STAS domain-containing protein n=1 Tax=Cerasicoccus fimbriatus TaxID=3014554 RepID=UPI0022B5570A|nr:STAS domain-containing protein [Cerasicoccus sp. TK19100]
MPIFETQDQGEVLVIQLLATHLEAANAAEFKQELSRTQLPSSGNVLVDCAKLEFIDSSGLGALLHLNNSLSKEVRPLALKNLRPEVLSVVELLRLNTVFKLES